MVVHGFPSKVSLEIAGTEQLYQARRMIRGLGHVFFWTYSPTENGKDPVVTFVEPLVQVITPRGPSHGKQAKLAVRHEPNMKYKSLVFSMKNARFPAHTGMC